MKIEIKYWIDVEQGRDAYILIEGDAEAVDKCLSALFDSTYLELKNFE